MAGPGEQVDMNATISDGDEVKGNKLQAQITLPEGVDGVFVWKGKPVKLSSGKNLLTL